MMIDDKLRLLLQNWSFMRVIRVVFGTVMLITGFQTMEFIPFAIAGILLYQGIRNVGCGSCCSSSDSCEKE